MHPYLLISTAINAIMLAYDGHHFGQLPCLSGGDRIIAIPNDPLVIESKEIKRDLPNGKCKPDNIIVQLSHLLKLDNTCDYRAWVQSIGTESKEWKRIRKDAGDKTSWLEDHCFLELEAHRVIECAPLDQPMSEKQVLGSSTFLVQLPILISFLTLYLQRLPLLHLMFYGLMTPRAKVTVDWAVKLRVLPLGLLPIVAVRRSVVMRRRWGQSMHLK